MSSVTQVSQHTFEIGGMGGAPEPPPSAHVAAPAPARPAAPALAAPSAPGAPLSARDLLRQLKARRRAVRAELAAKKRLELELAQLDRLIRAASTELDNVRRLRAAG